MKVSTELDLCEVFPRAEGVILVLLIDGHQSRLNPKFLTYINDQGHRWKVCLGVPYGTTLWQVGDSSEQNGTAKTEWYPAKQNFFAAKNIT